MLDHTHADRVFCCPAMMIEITVLWDVVDSSPNIDMLLLTVWHYVPEECRQHNHCSLPGPQILYIL
jgi:hypothetical protein